MGIDHDQPSGTLTDLSGMQVMAPTAGIDPLTDVLRTVKLTGALFFLVDASSPWCVDIPHARDYAEIILPGARHIVSYHIIVKGEGLASVPGLAPVRFGTGDIIVFPHADPYLMTSAPGVPPEFDREQTLEFFRALAEGKMSFIVKEGGGEEPKAEIICGFLGCDLNLFNPLLATLPRMLCIRRPAGNHPDLLDQLTELAMVEMQTTRVGGASIRLGLSELMFIELLRRHLETRSDDASGWLAGLRDPAVARAIALLHANPSHGWTLDTLARESGASRSVLAERFARCVGKTPMRYLTLWRMQLAARQLADGNAKVAAIGERVGFNSEAAFSRTFKKVTGLSPRQWRLKHVHSGASPMSG